MLEALVLILIGTVLAAVVMVRMTIRRRREERETFIRDYRFPSGVLEALRKSHPSLTDADVTLIVGALRQFFIVHARADRRVVAMPSKAVDALWHEFILDTREYHEFCRSAFGRYFHHLPAARMVPGVSSQTALRRSWQIACALEGINSNAPDRLPLLFAIDTMVGFPDGNEYSLTRPLPQQGAFAGGCGGFACGGDGLAGGAADGGGGCGGGGCGGGCGGGS